MVNVLIGNKNTREIDILCQELANEKNYRVDNAITGYDAISMYWKVNPDILVLDNNLSDISLEDIVNRLSSSPVERKRCNTILTLSPHYSMKLNNVAKINEILYKPIQSNELVEAIKMLSIDYNTPDIEFGEIDWGFCNLLILIVCHLDIGI